MVATLEEIIAKVDDDKPELVLTSIPADKRKHIPDEICKLLINNGLRQALNM